MIDIFDNIMAEVLSRKALTKERVVKVAVKAFEDEAPGSDLSDSTYYDHELVQKALKELHPERFQEEVDG